MAYIDKINKNNTDYDLQDSKAARSVNGTTDSHVELTDEIYTESTQVGTGTFIFRTTAGDLSIETGDTTIQHIDGNTIQTGHTDEVLEATGVFADSGTTVALTKATWRSYVANNGTYTFTYDGTNWKLNDATVTLADYGLTVTGTVAEGDSITVDYIALVIGSLATATPTSFVATGFNQYDATAGYSHVVGGNQYRIDGTYISLGFTTTVGGATTPVTVTNNRFTPTEDGYIYITGGSGDILIALVWSGTMDSEPYSAYSTTTVTIPTVDAENNSLPTATYGMPSVHGVADRLSFADKTYIQRIGHYTYSAENLATVQALDTAYVYDLSDIFYVLPEPVTYTLADSVSGTYTANDYGTEEITGTTVPVTVGIVYGNSLVDKLRNMLPIQSIGAGLTLTGTELRAEGGGGGVTTLTTADYNYPTNSPTGIAVWLLDSGLYKLGGSGAVNIKPNQNIGYSYSAGTSFLVLKYEGGGNSVTYMAIRDGASNNGYLQIFVTNNNTGANIANTRLATLSDIYADPSSKQQVQIGFDSIASGNEAIAIGVSSRATNSGAISIAGNNGPGTATASGYGSVLVGFSGKSTAIGAVALGAYSNANVRGQVDVGATDTYFGYNTSNYRLLTGLYDGQSDHDAVTVGQLNTAIINGGTTAPTTATVGAVGTLYSYVDTTGTTPEPHLMVCTVADTVTPSYTWVDVMGSVATALNQINNGGNN